MAEKKYMSLENLQEYDALIKAKIDEGDAVFEDRIVATDDGEITSEVGETFGGKRPDEYALKSDLENIGGGSGASKMRLVTYETDWATKFSYAKNLIPHWYKTYNSQVDFVFRYQVNDQEGGGHDLVAIMHNSSSNGIREAWSQILTDEEYAEIAEAWGISQVPEGGA